METQIIEHVPGSLLEEACKLTSLSAQEVILVALRDLIAKHKSERFFQDTDSLDSSIEIESLLSKVAEA